MSKDYENFIYKKMQIEQETQTYFYWYLIHKETRNGTHFHGCQYEESWDGKIEGYKPWSGNSFRFNTLGIELHSTKKMYDNQKPLKDCDVTKGDCYCDGTSLGASEKLGWIDPNSAYDEEHIWLVLHDYYQSYFGDGNT